MADMSLPDGSPQSITAADPRVAQILAMIQGGVKGASQPDASQPDTTQTAPAQIPQQPIQQMPLPAQPVPPSVQQQVAPQNPDPSLDLNSSQPKAGEEPQPSKPGPVKSFLISLGAHLANGVQGGSDALAHSAGLPTSYEKQQNALKMGLQQQTANDMSGYRQALTDLTIGKGAQLDAMNQPFVVPNDPSIPAALRGQTITQGAWQGLSKVFTQNQGKTDVATIGANARTSIAANKPMQRDDRFIADQQAKYEALGLDPTTAYDTAYHDWVDTTKVQPGVLRMDELLKRPIGVADPSTPGGVVYSTLAGSIGKQAPAGIATQIPLRTGEYMTSGQGGSTITAGNVLTHHLNLYDKAVDAIQNGNVKVLNQLGNELGIQLGSDKKTNLDLIQQGVAMEAARYWTGGVPGDAEINSFKKSLSGDGSPKQMHNGANTVRAMAKGKLQGLQGQAQAGASGQANFNDVAAPNSNTTPNAPDPFAQFGGKAH